MGNKDSSSNKDKDSSSSENEMKDLAQKGVIEIVGKDSTNGLRRGSNSKARTKTNGVTEGSSNRPQRPSSAPAPASKKLVPKPPEPKDLEGGGPGTTPNVRGGFLAPTQSWLLHVGENPAIERREASPRPERKFLKAKSVKKPETEIPEIKKT